MVAAPYVAYHWNRISIYGLPYWAKPRSTQFSFKWFSESPHVYDVLVLFNKVQAISNLHNYCIHFAHLMHGFCYKCFQWCVACPFSGAESGSPVDAGVLSRSSILRWRGRRIFLSQKNAPDGSYFACRWLSMQAINIFSICNNFPTHIFVWPFIPFISRAENC